MTADRVDKNVKDSTDVSMTFNHSNHTVNQIIMNSLASNLKKYINLKFSQLILGLQATSLFFRTFYNVASDWGVTQCTFLY